MPLPILNPRRVSKEDDDERVGGQDAWVTIDKTIGKVDEEKVKDYMDDIDTLLVFAGLYSAVLTAFLIESYKNLSADPTQALLQQLVGQTANYRFTSGHLNTTFTISQLPAFEVPTSAIRVNVCWFASLIISISTASYGILVKQWLREYLAIDRTALQERLRIRHFRAKGLKAWKLFEIAATLPMFLQIALTLFFVGLCFFTQSVHQTIGRTSVILVCAWAFFFALSVLAPLVSARCPYKTTFLKAIFRYLRPRIHHVLSLSADKSKRLVVRLHSSSLYTQLQSAARMVSDHLLGPCSLALKYILRRVSSLWHDNPHESGHTEQHALTSATQDNETSTPALLTYGNKGWKVKDDLFHVEYMNLFTKDTLEDPTYAWTEESELGSDDSGDYIIFRDADSIFLDDRILGMMREAFQRKPPSGEDILKFVVGVLEQRSGLVFAKAETKSITPVQWPWALSLNARTTLVELLVDSIRTQLSKTSVWDWWRKSPESDPGSYWMNRTLSLIISLCAGNGDLPQSLSFTLEDQLRDEEQAESCCCVLAYQLGRYLNGLTPAVSLNWQAHVFALLLPVLRTLPIEEAAGTFIRIVYQAYGNMDVLIETHCPKRTDKSISERNPQDGPESGPTEERKRVLSPEIVLLLTDVAACILRPLVSNGETAEAEGNHIVAFPKKIESLLDFMMKAIPVIQRELPGVHSTSSLPIHRGHVGVLLWRLLTRPRYTHSFLDFWSTRSGALQAQLWTNGLLYNTSHRMLLLGQQAVEFLLACAGYFDAMAKAEDRPALSSVIQTCHLVSLVRISKDTDVLRAWHGMFRSATTLINQICLAHGDIDRCDARGHEETCAAAYTLLKAIDRNYWNTSWGRICGVPEVSSADPSPDDEDGAYKTWLARLNIEEDQVPDAFINTLLQRVCDVHTRDEKGRTFWRVRRLQEQPEQHAEPEGTAAAVLASAKKNGFSHSCVLPRSRLMDLRSILRDPVESSGLGVTSVHVAPADTLPSHSSSPHTAAKEVMTEPLTEGTTMPPQSLVIEPVTEELSASSAVGVDVDASPAPHPVDGAPLADGNEGDNRTAFDNTLAMIKHRLDLMVASLSQRGMVLDSEQPTGASMDEDVTEELAASSAIGVDIDASPAAHPVDEAPLADDNEGDSRTAFDNTLAMLTHRLDLMVASLSQRGMVLDSEQPTGASEDEDEDEESGR